MASSPTPAMDLPTILAALQGLLGRRDISLQEFQNWEGGAVNGGPNGDGIYPLSDSTGLVRSVPCPAKIISSVNPSSPEGFGAIGDGGSHPANTVFASLAACQAAYPFATSLAQEMDFLAWQKMVKTPGYYRAKPGATYIMCNANPDSQQPLDYIAGISDTDGAYCYLDWSAMRVKTSDQHFVPNYNAATPDGWQNSTQYGTDQQVITLVDFSQNNGAIHLVDPWDGTKTGGKVGQGPYYEFGHAFTLAPGRYTAILQGTATRGPSYDHGNSQPPYGGISFNTGGPGAGPNPFNRGSVIQIGFDAVDPVNNPAPFESRFDFEVTADNAGPGWLTFKGGGYLNALVTRMDIVPFIPNAGILFNRDGAPAHYFHSRRLRRLTMNGPSYFSGNKAASAGTIGCLWKSFEDLDGDLQHMEGVRCQGFGIATSWSDGAYLMRFWDCDFAGDTYAIDFQPGSANAGENIVFFGGGLSNSNGGSIINNPGSAEITLNGTICDYSTQFCSNNAGMIRIIGARHEQNKPGNTTSPIWHCVSGGRVIYMGCFVLLAGNLGEGIVPPAKLDSALASIEFHACEIYGLNSIAGYVIDGPGRINFYGYINGGNANLGRTMITKNRHSDVLGGAGLFEPPVNPSYLAAQSPLGIYLEGGVAYSPRGGTRVNQWASSYLSCTLSTDYALTGAHSLKVQKTSGVDNTVYSEIYFLVPLEGVGNILGEIHFLFPNAIDPSTVTAGVGPPLFYRQFFVRVIGKDADGLPVFADNSSFTGEDDIHVPVNGDPVNWIQKTFSTTYQTGSQTDDASDRSPVWATHLAIVLDAQSLPATTFYIDGLQANFIG